MHHPRIFGAAPILAVVALVSCTVKEAPDSAATDTAAVTATPAAGANVVHVVGKDFSFEAPAQIPAGLTTMHLMNEGKEVHQVQIIRLTEGKTFDDFTAAMKASKPGAPPPSWVVLAGGPNAAPPGGTAAATSTLDPGNYALVCFIPSTDGVPHAMKGMTRGLVVTAATTTPAPEPAPTTTLTLSDYKFEFSTPLKSGENVIRVENAAGQPHEVVLFKLAPGKTMADFQKWLPVSDKDHNPPGMPSGGVVGLVKGQHAFFTANLDAGDYVLVCFFPDAKDQQPHFVHGMVQALKIT
ncbi:MAG TPA: hypothetical protein VES88_17110 [Gemmatimonadaceae bacterium]|nr:hypothetical protein [Gemmatimonadaceae bacterium]